MRFGNVEGSLVTFSSSQAIGFELCGAGAGTCRFVAGQVEGSQVVWRPARRTGAHPGSVLLGAESARQPVGWERPAGGAL